MEGIDVAELVYKPVEGFAEAQLSPRLVKLRYDFFEAKRRDLINLAIKARNRVLNDRKLNRPRSSSITRSTDASTRSASNDNWGILSIERDKFIRFEEGERKWLENCLNHELKLLRQLEADDHRLTEESNDSMSKLIGESRRIKEMNDRRRVIDEQKQRVGEAQQALEKEKAKQAFERHQEELKQQQESEMNKKKQAHLKSIREAEARKQKEIEKKKQQDQLWEDKQEALKRMQEHDQARIRIIEGCKDNIMKRLHQKSENKQSRVSKSIEKNKVIEQERKQILMKKLLSDRNRDERLEASKQNQLESSAKKALELMLKRKYIQDESQRRIDMRRKQILDHQKAIDERIAEHEKKREKYLEFKRELELLKEHNKEMNVERQRKKEQYTREMYASKVTEKDAKIENIFAERQRLWDLRRKIAVQHQKSRDHVKRTIMEMRIKSKMDSKTLEEYVRSVLSPDKSLASLIVAQSGDNDDPARVVSESPNVEPDDCYDHQELQADVEKVTPDDLYQLARELDEMDITSDHVQYDDPRSDSEVEQEHQHDGQETSRNNVDNLFDQQERLNDESLNEGTDLVDATPSTSNKNSPSKTQVVPDNVQQFTRSIGDLGMGDAALTHREE